MPSLLRSLRWLALLATTCRPAAAQPAPRPNTHYVLREAAPAGAGFSTERLTKLDRLLQEYVTSGRQPGVVALVARNGQIIYHKAFGQADVAARKAMPRDAIVRIASQTKAITSIGVLMLFEDGRLLLDDPISKYIPAFKNPKVLDQYNDKDTTYTSKPARREITIRQLLTHTSGISYPSIGTKEAVAIYAKNRIPSGIGTPDGNLGAAIDRLAQLPLVHQPGERFTYGLNTDVLGRLIEVVSGQSLDGFLRARLFDPLGMNDTYFYLPPAKHSRLAALYTEDSTGRTVPLRARGALSPDYPKVAGTFYSGGAGLSSTAYDYALFLQMLLNDGHYNGRQLLSPATVRLILSNQIGELGVGPNGVNKFGLGFELTTERGAARLPVSPGSFSWGGIFGTTYWADPQQGLVAILLTQKYPNTTASDIGDKFRVLVYSALTDAGR